MGLARRRRTPRPASGPAPACRPRCGHRPPPPAGGGPTTSRRPGHPHGGERLLDDLLVRAVPRRTPRPPPGPPRRCHPGGPRAAAPGAPRRPRPGCARRRGARRRPTGWRCSRSRARAPRPRRRRRRPAARRRCPPASGRISPTTTRLPGLMMPDLVAGDVLQGGAQDLGVVEAHVGEHRHVAVAPRWCSPSGRRAHLDHGHVDRLVGEPGQGGGGEELEPGGRLGQQRLEAGQRLEHLDERGVVDRLAVAGQALVDPGQVGAGVGADGQALGRRAARWPWPPSSPCRWCR